MMEAGSHFSVIWLGNPETSDPRILQQLKQSIAGATNTIFVPDVNSGGGV